MTLAAIDPWVVDFNAVDDAERCDALEDFLVLVKEHPELEPLRFIDSTFWNRIYEWLEDPAARGRTIPIHDFNRLLGPLCCDDDAETGTGAGGDRWNREVDRAIRSDDSGEWRDPIVVVPQSQRDRWPDGHEITLGGRADRLLVVLEEPTSNVHFERDFDPWLCERARQSGDDRCARDLPRPVVTADRAMSEWVALLADVDDAVAGKTTTHLVFVAPEGWDPEHVGKRQWRDCPFGPHSEKRTAKGIKKGPRDRRGRIWDWDDGTHRNHWDVQHENERVDERMNVRPDGLITRHYGD